MRRDDQAAIQAWHLDVFIRLGYTPTQAYELHYAGYDVHELSDLILKGCPLELARRILAPL